MRRLVPAKAVVVLAVLALLAVAATVLVTAGGASAAVTFVQGAAFDDSGTSATLPVPLGQPVNAGDLLVGWFAQYGSPGQVQVSDSVNGAWTRAPGALQFGGRRGDIALYYLAGSRAAARGVTITVSASSGADFQGSAAEYSGIATSGPLSGVTMTPGAGASVHTAATRAVTAGQLVYTAGVAGVSPGAAPAPGRSQGTGFTQRASTASGSAFEADITSSAAGTVAGAATLRTATDWYAVVATFAPAPGGRPAPASPARAHPASPASSSLPSPARASPGSTLRATTSPATVASGISKVLVITEENHSSVDVFPSSGRSTAAMPYLWSLAQTYGYATNWSDIGHPSLPNYLAIFGGSAENLPADCAPAPGCSWPGPTVFSQAIAAGGTAKIYDQGMTAHCQTSNPGYYDVNHNPWVYYTGAAEKAGCASHDIPSGTPVSGALLSDINGGALPTVGLLKPDLANDTTDGTFAAADNCLKSWIPVIQSGPDWKAGRLAIVVTFDESDQGAGGENVPFVLIAPAIRNVVVARALNHYALTRFLDEVAGASLLGNAPTEPDIAPLFGVRPAPASPARRALHHPHH